MTGMEHAIEHATKVIGDLPGFTDAQVRRIAEDLAEAGLLAPAPLREEWGSEVRDFRPDRDPDVLYARDPDNAQWQIEHNPEWATGRIMHRYRTDWLPVDRAEGDGRAEQ